MPFFHGAHDFTMSQVEMNDVKGDYTKTETKNVTNNSDMNNQYTNSMVAKGNTEAYNTTVGNSGGNTISLGNGNTMMLGGIMGNMTPENAKALEAALAAIPAGILSNVSSVTAHTSFMTAPVPVQPYVPAPAPQSAPASDISKSLDTLKGLPASAWTQDMISALNQLVESGKSVMRARNGQR